MKKTVVSLLLALCLLLGCALAEGAPLTAINLDSAMPVANTPVKVKLAIVPQGGSQDFKVENNWMCQYLNKYSGLDIDWLVIDPSAAKERVALMLNSGDLPDGLLGFSFGAPDIVQYGVSEGLFRPIQDLLVYAPTLSAYLDEHPSAKAAMVASDGNMYGFPAFPNMWSYKMRFFINDVWLKNVGKENPKTLAELKDVLLAFRDQDANGNGDAGDEIPWVGSWNEGYSERNLILNAYGYVRPSGNLAVDYSTGEATGLVYIPYAAHYKDFLLYMRDLWNEKLLDPDMFTQTEPQAQAKILSGVNGFSGQSAPYVYDPEHQADWNCVNVLVDEEGDTPVFPGPNTLYTVARAVISADASDEAAAALANLYDFFYTLEGWGFATFGPEAGSEYDWNGTGHYYDPETNSIQYHLAENMTSAWTHRITYLTIYSNPGFNSEGYDPYRLEYAAKYPDSAIGQQYKNGIVVRKDESDQQEKEAPYYVDDLPTLYFTVEDQDRLNELTTPLDDYVASCEAKFITGEMSIENDFDGFIKTLEEYGVEEYLEIYNKYYSAYKAN